MKNGLFPFKRCQKAYVQVHRDDSTIKIWDCVNFSLVRIIIGHEQKINDVKYVSDNRLVSCSDDNTVRLWNYETGECVQLFHSQHKDIIVIDNKFICGLCMDDYVDEELDSIYFLKLHNKDNLDNFQDIYFEKLLCKRKGLNDYILYKNFVYLGDHRFAISYTNEVKIFDFNGNK
jgi:WD40 repeat protein